ncbi:MAG: hypothetical protein KA007_02680 [Candidatus Pacebacteria bacterium]|nr:hypothetical protein [Candidatus Paceibacterota bacterium]
MKQIILKFFSVFSNKTKEVVFGESYVYYGQTPSGEILLAVFKEGKIHQFGDIFQKSKNRKGKTRTYKNPGVDPLKLEQTMVYSFLKETIGEISVVNHVKCVFAELSGINCPISMT